MTQTISVRRENLWQWNNPHESKQKKWLQLIELGKNWREYNCCLKWHTFGHRQASVGAHLMLVKLEKRLMPNQNVLNSTVYVVDI